MTTCNITHPALFHSQDQEVELIREYLGDQGFFVDVGANDPFQLSQSLVLEQAGWQGICIEPQPGYADALRRNRKATVVQKACGAPESKDKKLTLSVLGSNAALEPHRIFSAFDVLDRIEVEMDTLDNILDECQATRVDFLSLDVEGYEPEVLKGFDIQRWAPRLILCEDHLFNLDKHRALRDAGYKWVRRTQYNNWYVPQNALFPVSLFGKWQLFRKAYLGRPFRNMKKQLHQMRGK